MPLSHREKAFNGQCIREKIISNNGPCFRSDNFHSFCDQLNNVTSKPYIIKVTVAQKWQLLLSHRFCRAQVTLISPKPWQHTLILQWATFYHHQPSSSTASKSTTVSVWLTLTPLTDQQKSQLSEKCLRIWSLWRGQLHLPAKPTHLVHCERIPDQIHTGSSMTRPTEGLDKISVTSSSIMLLFHSSNPKCTL